jgi:hypothetical protein
MRASYGNGRSCREGKAPERAAISVKRNAVGPYRKSDMPVVPKITGDDKPAVGKGHCLQARIRRRDANLIDESKKKVIYKG